MAHVIAVAGKGGVGKIRADDIQHLCEQGKVPILAVDADANSNLNEVLGVKVDTTSATYVRRLHRQDRKGKSDPERNDQGRLCRNEI